AATTALQRAVARRGRRGLRAATVFHHVATFRFRPGTTEAQRAAVAAGLDELASTIPSIRRYRHGPDAGLADGNADWAVVADFDDEDGWRAYAQDPAHLAFIADVLAPVLESRTAVQFRR